MHLRCRSQGLLIFLIRARYQDFLIFRLFCCNSFYSCEFLSLLKASGRDSGGYLIKPLFHQKEYCSLDLLCLVRPHVEEDGSSNDPNAALPTTSKNFPNADQPTIVNSSRGGATHCYITYSCSRQTVHLMPERLLLKMPHTNAGETSSRNKFSHRPLPSSPDNRVLHNAGCEKSTSIYQENLLV